MEAQSGVQQAGALRQAGDFIGLYRLTILHDIDYSIRILYNNSIYQFVLKAFCAYRTRSERCPAAVRRKAAAPIRREYETDYCIFAQGEARTLFFRSYTVYGGSKYFACRRSGLCAYFSEKVRLKDRICKWENIHGFAARDFWDRLGSSGMK